MLKLICIEIEIYKKKGNGERKSGHERTQNGTVNVKIFKGKVKRNQKQKKKVK